jgi:hypothetical protein
MRRLALVALLTACASRSSSPPRTEAPADAAPVAPVVVAAPDAAPPPPVDPCVAIADLFAEVCGGDAAALTADPDEGTDGRPRCSRFAGHGPTYTPFRYLYWREDPAAARKRYDDSVPTPSDRRTIEAVALGDAADLVHDHTAKNAAERPTTLRVVRGGDYLVLVRRKGSCSDDQLVELARRALETL